MVKYNVYLRLWLYGNVIVHILLPEDSNKLNLNADYWLVRNWLVVLWPKPSHQHNLYTAVPPPLSSACLLFSSLCLSPHTLNSLYLVNAPPFPCPHRCVLNACSSYRCHSGVWPGLRWSLPGLAELEAQLHQEHELWQPRLPQNHRRERGGRDPHWKDWLHGAPRAPPPISSGSQHGSYRSWRRHLPAVHCPATRGKHAWSRDSLVHGAAHALHCKVTPPRPHPTPRGYCWWRWHLKHTVRAEKNWTSLGKWWTTYQEMQPFTAMSEAKFD